MRQIHVAAIVLCLAASGCQTMPKDPPVWVRTDGRSVVGHPELQAKFQIDSTICQGEMAKVAGGAPPIYYQGLGGLMMAAAVNEQRSQIFAQVGIGCMAERGYVLSSASKVEATAAQFRKISRR